MLGGVGMVGVNDISSRFYKEMVHANSNNRIEITSPFTSAHKLGYQISMDDKWY